MVTNCDIKNMTDEAKIKPLDYMKTDIPKLGGPAQRALCNAGLTSIAKLSKAKESDIADLHGMGPSSIKILKQALKDKGKTFRK